MRPRERCTPEDQVYGSNQAASFHPRLGRRGWSVGHRLVSAAVEPAVVCRQATCVVPGQVALNGWVKVSADNSVTVMMSQAEMGQGAHTGLAMLVADEMDAAWEQVRLEQSGFDPIYNNQEALSCAFPRELERIIAAYLSFALCLPCGRDSRLIG